MEVEGSYSSKAIAFISRKSNPRNTRLKTITYFILYNSPQKTWNFSKNTFSIKKRILSSFGRKTGNKKWIK